MSDEWGPWIDHDGGSLVFNSNVCLEVTFQIGGIEPPSKLHTGEQWPGFLWRWRTKRTGWFGQRKTRVCDDPAYAPVWRYRIRKPRGLTILEGLLENLPEKVDA
jgi:hypothetical protein